MGKNHTGMIRGFYWHSQSWYGPMVPVGRGGATDCINVGFYDPDGGTTGEFSFTWHVLSNREHPRLNVFDDAWHALAQMPELIAALADLDDKDVSPATMAALLIGLGFRDLTKRERK